MPVQAAAVGSVKQLLTVLRSEVRVVTVPSWAGMEEEALQRE